jgi:hypothetical protein
MSLNVAKLTDMTHNAALESQALEARQWSIINNAVRELTQALGYYGPIRDNDSRIAMAIKAAASRLHGPEAVEAEHAPLVIPGQPTSPEIEKIYDILENGLAAEIVNTVEAAVETPVVNAKLPAPNQAKPKG